MVMCLLQVLAEEGKAKAVAFDEIDKAPEEKKRGITIATVGYCFLSQLFKPLPCQAIQFNAAVILLLETNFSIFKASFHIDDKA